MPFDLLYSPAAEDVDDGAERRQFYIPWRYNDDEKSLRILAIASAQVPRNPSDDAQ